MLRPPRSLLAALAATTLVVTLAVSWAGWRLLDQQGAIDDQRAWEQIETSADALAADVRGNLAETGERISAWVADPAALPPVIDGAVVVAITAEQLLVAPAGGLPFVPVVDGRACAQFEEATTGTDFFGRRLVGRAGALYLALFGQRVRRMHEAVYAITRILDQPLAH